MFEQSFLDQVRDRSDLLEMVGAVVKLKKAGKDYQGLCPFHSEKSPSFTVTPAKQFYHCFGCGAHGGAIDWFMFQTGSDFIEAVEGLAHSAGLSVPERRPVTPQDAARRDKNIRHTDILTQANRVFYQNLRSYPDVVSYILERGLTKETVQKFRIGYADGSLQIAMAAVPRAELVAAGLVIDADSEQESHAARHYRDRFRSRLMFPIQNERGDVVGFGGRVLDAGQPKYLNSADSDLFHKGEELYGLHLAKQAIRASRQAIVVEGYMDVAMLHQHGEERAVAGLGTSVTETQIVRLFRMSEEIVFCFDGDPAGQRAADRAALIALEIIPDGKRARFVMLPSDHDPDSYVRAHGLAAWQGFIQDAGIPLSKKIIELVTRGRDIQMPEDAAAIAVASEKTLSSMRNAPTYQKALKVAFENILGMRVEMKNEIATAVESSSSQPRPEPSRTTFYRRFALLCCLDQSAIQKVPTSLVDDFAALVSTWYACAPSGLRERIALVSTVKYRDLRSVLIGSIESLRERELYLENDAIGEEVEAILEGMHAEVAKQQRLQAAQAIFA